MSSLFDNKDKTDTLSKKCILPSVGSGGSGNGGNSSHAPSEIDSIGTSSRTATPTPSLMSNLRISKNEVSLSHKTKVSQVRPPSRIVYEWEWDIPKFDKAFPPLIAGSLATVANAGRLKILKSNKIVAGADIGRKCELYFILSESNGKLSWYVSLGKICCKSDSKWIHAAFSFKVVDAMGNDLLHRQRCFRDFQEGFKFGWDDIIELEKLYGQKDLFLPENTLKMQVLFEMYSDAQQCHGEAVKQERDEFAKRMTSDMWRLRTATGTADIHLECEGKVFPVHRLILSARSATFSRMFDTPVLPTKPPRSQQGFNPSIAGGDNPPEKEQTVGSVSISDVEPGILEIVLDYIYSGSVKPLSSPDILTGVIRAADKFELGDLKAFCFHELMNFVTEDNIGNLAVLAFRHNAEKGVRMNINGYCLRNLTSLMRRKAFRDALKMEPDAFFPDDDN